MTHWLKSMGTRVGMEHVQERPRVQLSTSHTHINIPTCGVFIIISKCIYLESYNHNTHQSIYDTTVHMGYLCVCNLWTVGHEVVLEHVPSLPLSPYFLTSESSLHFLKIKKKIFNVLCSNTCVFTCSGFVHYVYMYSASNVDMPLLSFYGCIAIA